MIDSEEERERERERATLAYGFASFQAFTYTLFFAATVGSAYACVCTKVECSISLLLVYMCV